MTTVVAANSQALWYLTRASGVVALLLLTATTLLGVLSANRWRSTRWPRFAVADLHRNLTLLAMVFIGVHVVTTVADSYAPIGISDAFIPFTSAYRPIWLGFGALALDLLLALVVTSLLRKRIGYRTWRAVHWAAYGTWPLALAHGLGSGSDARLGWMALLTYSCIAVVGLAVATRLVQGGVGPVQVAAGVSTLAVAVVLLAWYRSGPAQRGWAARAGTPKTLLKATSPSRAAQQQRQLAASTTVTVSHRFDGRLVGRMSSSGPDQFGDAAVAIAVAVRGADPGLARMTLWGSALDGGGLAMSRSTVTFTEAVTGTVYTGSIVGLDGNRVVADVASPSGTSLRLTFAFHLDPSAGAVTGTVRVRPSGGDSS